MSQFNDIALRCPCCSEIRRYGNLEHLRKWNAQFRSPWILSPIECAGRGHLQWACDECLKKKRALLGRPERQNVIGMTHPYFAYYDQQRKCSSCGLGFTFSKEEQQYWYEELQFITWSDAKDCVECRKAKREPKERNAKISNLVRDLVPENLDQIEELVQLYLEIGNTEKAKYFMSIGRKNVNDKNSDKIKERLERVKERIVAYENSNGQPDRGR